MRICIVATELDTRPTGWLSRAAGLAARGHEVTMLWESEVDLPAASEAPSVRFERLEPDDVRSHVPDHRTRSGLVYRWLSRREPDVVHFAGRGGVGFYSLLARGQDVALGESLLVVEAVEGSVDEADGTALISSVDDLERDFMERESLLRADVVHGEPRAIASWKRRLGDVLPARRGPAEELDAWLDWHTELASEAPFVRPAPSPSTPEPSKPLVSVCIPIHDRHRTVVQALESIRSQDYEPIEVVLVDDGSETEEVGELLDSLEPEFGERGWTIVRQPNLYLGAARNRAVREAKGDLVLFLDDDDWLPDHAVSTLVRACLSSGAELVTPFVQYFSGELAPAPTTVPEGRWLPLGGAVEAGPFRNVFGSATALVRKTAFDWLGGFTEDEGVGHEDWELYARAALEGFRIEVVPEPLLWYRRGHASMLESTSKSRNLARSLRPYLGRGRVHDAIVRLAAGAFHAGEERDERRAAAERRLEESLVEERSKVRELQNELQRLHAEEESDIDALLESARLLASRGQGDTVRAILEEVDSLASAMGHPEVQMSAASQGASILADLGHVELAEAWLARALEAGQGNESPSRVLGVLLSSAETLSILGRSEAARQHLASAVVLAYRTGDKRAVTSTLLPKARVLAGAGEHESAWEVLEHASDAARERGDGRTLAKSLLEMADLVERMGEGARAVQLLVEAMRAARQTGHTSFLLDVLIEASEQLRRVGSSGEATSVLHSAEALARQSGNALAHARLQEMTERLQMEPGG